ncbi:MAG: hypothetical protein Q9220_005450 [cf. Caloplaca sp. 1 TL-2023]
MDSMGSSKEKGKQLPVSGKRSRQVLGESSTNAPSKRVKSGPVSKTVVGKISTSGKLSIPNETVDNVDSARGRHSVEDGDFQPAGQKGEEEDEEIGDQADQKEVFDLDPEEPEDADSTKIKQQDDEIKEWFDACEKHDTLRVTAEERSERIKKCEERFASMLNFLVQTAMTFQKHHFQGEQQILGLPFRFVWWSFFLIMDQAKVIVRLMASLPDAVKAILGGSLAIDELLMLPSMWAGCSLWGIYCDVLVNTGDTPGTALYCGSGTDKRGIWARLEAYRGAKEGIKNIDDGAHPTCLLREDTQMNLRVMAVFNKFETPKPYVMLMELLVTMLLGSLETTSPGRNRPTSAITMAQNARPEGLPVGHTCLNKAIQCHQGLFHRHRTADKKCSNCTCTENYQWHLKDPGLPFGPKICKPCYAYRKSKGKDRPQSCENKRVWAANNKKTVKTPVNTLCPSCNGPVSTWLRSEIRSQWECENCYLIQDTSQITKVEQAELTRKALMKKTVKPAANTPCPGCGHIMSNRDYMLFPYGEICREPGRDRYECKTCYEKTSFELENPDFQDKQQAGIRSAWMKETVKPAANTLCPGCRRAVPNQDNFVFPYKDLFLEPGRARYECKTCYKKPSSRLMFPPGQEVQQE